MGTYNFSVKPIKTFKSPVVEFEKRVFDLSGNPIIISPGKENQFKKDFSSLSISIYEINDGNNKIIPLRELSKTISIEITPDFVNEKSFYSQISGIINPGENAEDTVALSILTLCPKLNYVVDSRLILLNDIRLRKPIIIGDINLNDIAGKIEVISELIRIKGSNQVDFSIANTKYSIIAWNKTISFYVDEIEEIGGDSLRIQADELEDKLFKFENVSPYGSELPLLKYHIDFKPLFTNGDRYRTVQMLLMTIGQPYFDHFLKWAIFGRPDFRRNDHLSILKMLSELCELRENDLEELNTESDSEQKLTMYFKFSNILFLNLQNLSKTWKNIAFNLINNEKI